MNGLGRTAILTMVSLLFLVTQGYAYFIDFGGVNATQNGVSAGLTADRVGIDPTTNTATQPDWFIETFDLPTGGGGFNTLNATKLDGDIGNYGFSNTSITGAAAPADDETFFFFTPKQPNPLLPATIIVPNTAFFAYQPGLFIDYMGLYFGSIDRYNSLEFYLLDGRIIELTGTDILTKFYTDTKGEDYSGDWNAPASNVYVNINFDLPSEVFTAFALKTTDVALEIDNIVAHVSPVPEPSTFILFGAGLLGLVALGRKRFAQ